VTISKTTAGLAALADHVGEKLSLKPVVVGVRVDLAKHHMAAGRGAVLQVIQCLPGQAAAIIYVADKRAFRKMR
jgi:hypothetical protein